MLCYIRCIVCNKISRVACYFYIWRNCLVISCLHGGWNTCMPANMRICPVRTEISLLLPTATTVSCLSFLNFRIIIHHLLKFKHRFSLIRLIFSCNSTLKRSWLKISTTTTATTPTTTFWWLWLKLNFLTLFFLFRSTNFFLTYRRNYFFFFFFFFFFFLFFLLLLFFLFFLLLFLLLI